MSEIEQKRIERTKAEAGLVEITFPACCISCDNSNESISYCKELKIPLDNAFVICNFYSD